MLSSSDGAGLPLDPITSQKRFAINLAKENAVRGESLSIVLNISLPNYISVENYELAKQLKDIGFTNITIVVMNLDDWQKQRHPFIKNEAK